MRLKPGSRQWTVAVLGATGMVGRRFAELLHDHPWFRLGMLIGHKSIGEPYGRVWARKEAAVSAHYWQGRLPGRPCPPALRDEPVRSVEDLLRAPPVDLVFSAVPQGFGEVEQAVLDRGHLMFSNSPHGRFEGGNPLVVAEVNGGEIERQRFIKNPNCVTSGLTLVLDAIGQRYGLEEVSAVTFQSLSGRGDALYELDLVQGNVYPLHGSSEKTEHFIQREVQRILGGEVRLSVSCNRVYVQEGHFVDVKLKTARPIESAAEAAETLAGYAPLVGLPLPSRPAHPIVIVDGPGRPRPREDADHGGGMAIAVGNISTADDVYDLRLQFVVNNLVRGAAGGAVLNAELYVHKNS